MWINANSIWLTYFSMLFANQNMRVRVQKLKSNNRTKTFATCWIIHIYNNVVGSCGKHCLESKRKYTMFQTSAYYKLSTAHVQTKCWYAQFRWVSSARCDAYIRKKLDGEIVPVRIWRHRLPRSADVDAFTVGVAAATEDTACCMLLLMLSMKSVEIESPKCLHASIHAKASAGRHFKLVFTCRHKKNLFEFSSVFLLIFLIFFGSLVIVCVQK